jgi:hypothetical protein
MWRQQCRPPRARAIAAKEKGRARLYGTIARCRLASGAEPQLLNDLKEFEALHVPGFIGTYIYRMDDDPQTCYMAVVFESKAAHWANAHSPEQDARYQKMRAHFAADPEWHDGEIIASTMQR